MYRTGFRLYKIVSLSPHCYCTGRQHPVQAFFLPKGISSLLLLLELKGTSRQLQTENLRWTGWLPNNRNVAGKVVFSRTFESAVLRIADLGW